MTDAAPWIIGGIALYGLPALVCGAWALRRADGAGAAALTAALFGAWVLWLLPAGVAAGGFPVGYGALACIAVCVPVLAFARRQWVLARRFGFANPAAAFERYYGSHVLREATWLIESVLFLSAFALVCISAGTVVAAASGLDLAAGTALFVAWVVGFVWFVDARKGGVLGVLQFGLIAAALLAVGTAVLDAAGGWSGLGERIAASAASSSWGSTNFSGGGDYSTFLALAGVFQDAPGGIGQPTAVFAASAMLGLTGLAFAPFVFAAVAQSPDGAKVALRMPMIAGLVFGGLAVLFAVAWGAALAPSAGSDPAALLAALSGVADLPAWILVLLSAAMLSGMHALAAALLRSSSIARGRSEGEVGPVNRLIDILINAAFVAVFVYLGIGLDTLALYSLFGLALTLQLLPAMTGLCWAPWLTRRGVLAGLFAGVAAVCLTGMPIATLNLQDLFWPRWPLGVYSAGWGLAVNVIVAVAVSALTQNEGALAHRRTFHAVLDHHAPIPGRARGLIPAAWIFTIAWFLFAVGPGAVIGNDIFGRPDGGVQGWNFGLPSIWVWQMAAWGSGVLLLRFLARGMGLADRIEGKVTPAEPPPDA